MIPTNLPLYSWLCNNLIEERNRWFCWIPFFVGLGITSSVYPKMALYCCIAPVFTITLLLTSKNRLYLQVFIVVAAVTGGYFITEQHRHGDHSQQITNTTAAYCKARIDKIDNNAKSVIITSSIKDWFWKDKESPPLPIDAKIRIIAKGKIRDSIISDGRLLPQSLVRMHVLLSPLPQPQYLGDFDTRKISILRGISANGIMLSPPKVICSATGFWALIYKIRSDLNRYFKSHLDPDQYTIACALITGEPLISQGVRSNFADAGMAHILAISGLHLCILGGVIFAAFRWFFALLPVIALRYNTKKLAAVISFIAAIIYLFISGNKIPATRALVVYAIVTLGIITDRQPISMRSLSIAAFIIMIFAPEAIFLPGFQMSFAATAALIAAYESVSLRKFFERARKRFISKIGVYMLSTVCSTIAASLSVIPFTVNSFNKLTLNSIPSNILAIPLVGFVIIPCLILVIVFWWWPAVNEVFFIVVNWGITQLIRIADFVSELPGSQIICPTPCKWAMALFAVSFIWLVIWQQKWRLAGFLGIGLSLVVYISTPLPVLFIHDSGKAFAIRSKDHIITNTKIHARNIIKRWGLSVGCDKIEKQNSNCHFIQIGNQKLLIVPYRSEITVEELSIALSKTKWLIDLRPCDYKDLPEGTIPVIKIQHLKDLGSLSIYEKHGSIEITDKFGNRLKAPLISK